MECGGYDNGLPIMEDADLTMRLHAKGSYLSPGKVCALLPCVVVAAHRALFLVILNGIFLGYSDSMSCLLCDRNHRFSSWRKDTSVKDDTLLAEIPNTHNVNFELYSLVVISGGF